MEEKDLYPRLRLKVVMGPGLWIGPGKADLLEGIAATGSISAAGRRMGMSYKRAWGLVEVLNAMFDAPLVAASRGGAERGGAALTARGAEVLALYRRAEAASRAASAAEIGGLAALRRDMSDEK
ncbi:LysR family transcriptional regulator [Frigidibacter sp. SD6-1]|uniref:winged helix-turn-helix domain-containing protein n=1 Tax=Frigidibacter sp. SD6-1 TaxID=3032581 RepID=UPI0024DF39B7|nr:LysR family transcriptional regulator [Frigidibacter sp. SD6-1]